ncbi:hypothetical protein AB6A40_008990 [Gnathostoma spinigerum]|uniref:Proteasome subunit beta n=1 Tax=Gnathostoma spinigerum TaxID=75299 RepID=A0ABD6ER07_9BILA
MENDRTIYPTCTGTSVAAVAYNGGVAIMTDRIISYGKMSRYRHISRQYRVNSRVVVAFGGDVADFQWLQNVIERQVCNLRALDSSAEMSPRMLHGYLTSLLYYCRTRMNPVWNTLIVAGMQLEDGNLVPFIGVITPRGVAYHTKSVVTGLGAMLLNEAVETESRKLGPSMTKDQTVQMLRKCLELSVYHDCVTDTEFEISTVDQNGVTLGKPEVITGNWEIAEHNCDYE